MQAPYPVTAVTNPIWHTIIVLLLSIIKHYWIQRIPLLSSEEEMKRYETPQ
jgi:hypothetical protein